MSINNIQLNVLPKTVSISDLQKRTREIFMQTKDQGSPTVVLNRNETVGVLLKPELYEELIDVYEDYLDSMELEKAVKQTPKKEFKAWSEVKASLDV